MSRTRRCRSNGAWIGWTGKTYDYFLYVASTLLLRSTRVRRQHSPLSLLCITMILRVRRKFFEITTFPNTNTIIPYIKLYLRTIPEFLVMSTISSGTPNNIRLPTCITHIILYRQRMLSVRALRVPELCRHDRDTNPVNNQ